MDAIRPGRPLMRGRVRRVVLIAAGVAALLAPASAAAAGLSFTAPQLLPHGDPKGTPFLSGGEPSVAFDPNGDGHAYVVAPQSVPAVLTPNGVGVAYWASSDHGHTWPVSGLTGNAIGGGDSDVEVLQNHNVVVADLEAVAAGICISSDFAATFPGCSNGLSLDQAGPEDDRPWLTRGAQPNEIFLTYHDFVAGYPIVERSTDGGNTFTPCSIVIDPAGPAGQVYTPLGGALVSKPVVGKDGTLYIEFSTPPLVSSPTGAPQSDLFMAVMPQGNCTATPLRNYVIYQDPGADLGRIFESEGIDGGGELYVLTGGVANAADKGSNLYLFTSTDGGRTWSAPVKVNPPSLPANVFPWISGGEGKGEALLSWFGTATSNDPNNGKDQWHFYAATTYDGGQSFAYSQVSPQVMHYGDICTSGVACGTGLPGTGQNRNLADFASNAIDPSTGCGLLAIPGDPYNRPDLPNGPNNGSSSAYFSFQQGPTGCLTPVNAGQPAGAVVPSGGSSAASGCIDRIAPHSRFTARRVGRHGVVLRGVASDRGCGAHGAGHVARVRVALALVTGRKCRFLRGNGRLGPRGSCAHRTYLSATGTSRFAFTFRHRLRAGHYRAWSQAIDRSGNVERAAGRHDSTSFRIR